MGFVQIWHMDASSPSHAPPGSPQPHAMRLFPSCCVLLRERSPRASSSLALSPVGRATAVGDRRIATVASDAAVPLVLCAASGAERRAPGGSIGGKSAVRAQPSFTTSSSTLPKTKVRRGLPPSPRGARGERAASPRIRSAEEPPVKPGTPGTTKSTHPLAGRADPSGAARADGIKNPDRRSQRIPRQGEPVNPGAPEPTKSTISPRRERQSLRGHPSRRHQEPEPTASRTRADGIKNPSRRNQEPEPTKSTAPGRESRRDREKERWSRSRRDK